MFPARAARFRVASALNLLAKRRKTDPKLWAAYLKPALELAPRATAVETAIALNAFARSGIPDHREVAAAFYARALRLFPASSARHLAMMANAVAKLGLAERAFFEKMTEELQHKIHKCTRRDMANLANAYAKAGVADKAFFDVYLHEVVLRDAAKFQVKDLVQVLNAYAKVQHRNVEIFERLAQRCREQVHHMDGMGLSVIANAYEKVRIFDAALMEALAQRLFGCANSCTPQAVSVLLHAFVKLPCISTPAVLRCLHREVERTAAHMSPQGLAMSCYALGRAGYLQEQRGLAGVLADAANAAQLDARQAAMIIAHVPADLLRLDRLLPKVAQMSAVGAANTIAALLSPGGGGGKWNADWRWVDRALGRLTVDFSAGALSTALRALALARPRRSYGDFIVSVLPLLLRCRFDLSDAEWGSVGWCVWLLSGAVPPELAEVLRDCHARTPSLVACLALGLPPVPHAAQTANAQPADSTQSPERRPAAGAWQNIDIAELRAAMARAAKVADCCGDGAEVGAQVGALLHFLDGPEDAAEVLDAALRGAASARWVEDVSLTHVLRRVESPEIAVAPLAAPRALRRKLLGHGLQPPQRLEHGPFVLPLACRARNGTPVAMVVDEGAPMDVVLRCAFLAARGWHVACVPGSWLEDTSWVAQLAISLQS